MALANETFSMTEAQYKSPCVTGASAVQLSEARLHEPHSPPRHILGGDLMQ